MLFDFLIIEIELLLIFSFIYSIKALDININKDCKWYRKKSKEIYKIFNRKKNKIIKSQKKYIKKIYKKFRKIYYNKNIKVTRNN